MTPTATRLRTPRGPERGLATLDRTWVWGCANARPALMTVGGTGIEPVASAV
jgi:hypothetical protein